MVFSMIFIIYLFHKNPHTGFSDSLTLINEISEGFNPNTNATNHFLYINFLVLTYQLLSFAEPVTLMTWFSVICSLVSLYIFYRILVLLEFSTIVSLAATTVLAFSFTFWRISEIIEVYAFNNLFFLVFLFLAIKDQKTNSFRYFPIACSVLGLGLLVHIQNILLLPFAALYFIKTFRVKRWRSIYGTLFLLLFASPLFTMPVLYHANSLESVIFGTHYKNEVINFSFSTLQTGALLSTGYLVYNFSIFLLPVVHGFSKCYRLNRELFISLLWILFPFGGFAFRYMVGDNHVFFLPVYLTLGIFFAYGLYHWLEKYRLKKLRLYLPIFPIVWSLTFYTACTWGLYQVPQLQRFNRNTSWKGGLEYYFFPGMRNAKDPLSIAKRWYENDHMDSLDQTDWWNYEKALKYLEKQKKLRKNNHYDK